MGYSHPQTNEGVAMYRISWGCVCACVCQLYQGSWLYPWEIL